MIDSLCRSLFGSSKHGDLAVLFLLYMLVRGRGHGEWPEDTHGLPTARREPFEPPPGPLGVVPLPPNPLARR